MSAWDTFKALEAEEQRTASPAKPPKQIPSAVSALDDADEGYDLPLPWAAGATPTPPPPPSPAPAPNASVLVAQPVPEEQGSNSSDSVVREGEIQQEGQGQCLKCSEGEDESTLESGRLSISQGGVDSKTGNAYNAEDFPSDIDDPYPFFQSFGVADRDSNRRYSLASTDARRRGSLELARTVRNLRQWPEMNSKDSCTSGLISSDSGPGPLRQPHLSASQLEPTQDEPSDASVEDPGFGAGSSDPHSSGGKPPHDPVANLGLSDRLAPCTIQGGSNSRAETIDRQPFVPSESMSKSSWSNLWLAAESQGPEARVAVARESSGG
eukprot:gene11280-18912_t